MISKPYLKLYSELDGDVFTKSRVEEVLGTSENAAGVVLTRLKRDNMVFQPERASYRLLTPETVARLVQLKARDDKLYAVAVETLRHYPQLSMLLLYGSHARGDADELSDYDVLVVLPHPPVDAKSVKESIEEKLTVKVHLTVYSEEAYKTVLLMEPYVRMWLTEGIMLDEGKLGKMIPPPPPKMAYKEMLYTAETLMDVAGIEDDAAEKAKYLRKAATTLLIIEDLLDLEYDYGKTREKLGKLLGHETTRRIRRSEKLGEDDIRKLEDTVERERGRVIGGIDALGDNESDIKWRGMVA